MREERCEERRRLNLIEDRDVREVAHEVEASGEDLVHLLVQSLGVTDRFRLVRGAGDVDGVAATRCDQQVAETPELVRLDLVGHPEGEHRDRRGLVCPPIHQQAWSPDRLDIRLQTANPGEYATEGIRVGSGGVMLPHYSPLKVAETFTILAGLYPGRITSASGGLPAPTR